MSYRSYIGGPTTGYTNEQFGYAQTYMMMDIQALHLGLELVQTGMISLVVPYSAAAAALSAGKVSAAPVETLITTWVMGWPAENAPNLATRKLIEMIKLEAQHWPDLAPTTS